MAIEENIRLRKFTESLVTKVAALVKAELSGADAKAITAFWNAMYPLVAKRAINSDAAELEKWKQAFGCNTPEEAKQKTVAAKPQAEIMQDYRMVIRHVNRVLDKIDNLPEAAEDFAVSVRETITDMGNNIESSQRATPKQATAIQNIEDACDRWLKGESWSGDLKDYPDSMGNIPAPVPRPQPRPKQLAAPVTDGVVDPWWKDKYHDDDIPF